MESLNQAQTAKKLKISEAYLSLLLSGNRRPSWTIAKRLAKFFGTTEKIWMDGTPRQIKYAIKTVASLRRSR